MTELSILGAVILVIGIGIYLTGWRRKRILGRPFPAAWLDIVRNALPFYDRLSDDEQQQLLNNIRLFIADKRFHGCGGLTITDEIRVVVAAEACLLLLNRRTAVYPRLKHILIYPDAFRARHPQHNEDGTVGGGEKGLLGESWHYGKVILSWDDVVHGIRNTEDGQNVALHEFSHQLDSESGSANGAPPLHSNAYSTWASVLSKEFEELNRDFAHHHESVMDYYGATNPAEFFAVATETFFEKPRQMHSKHRELFEVLKTYYAVDPRRWLHDE